MAIGPDIDQCCEHVSTLKQVGGGLVNVVSNLLPSTLPPPAACRLPRAAVPCINVTAGLVVGVER
jgi:hypothetical protein